MSAVTIRVIGAVYLYQTLLLRLPFPHRGMGSVLALVAAATETLRLYGSAEITAALLHVSFGTALVGVAGGRVRVGVLVAVTIAVRVGVGVRDGVRVGVLVDVARRVAVGVAVGVRVGVTLGREAVAVALAVGVGELKGSAFTAARASTRP